MLLKLIRNTPQGNAITGRLVIDGRWYCNTLERVGYQIPALCYPVRVTQSPKFKRLLPLVCGVPRTMSNVESQKSKVKETSAAVSPDFKHSTLDIKQSALRSGIRFHVGSLPKHSTGCILVLADNNPTPLHPTPYTLHPPQGRTSADVEIALTNLLKHAQEHEEIILEITDFRPGTKHGYNTPCPSELQMP